MSNLLYYPYINVPQSDWAIRVLMYYDTIASIVPERYLGRRERYEPFMRELLDAELVVPIDPYNSFSSPGRLTSPFITYLKSEEFNLRKRRAEFSSMIAQRDSGKLTNSDFSRIHSDKFIHEVFYQLEQAGLAKRINHEWYLVEKKTAGELMTFIASVIAVRLNFLPTSDTLKNSFQAVGLRKKDYRQHNSENKRRQLILRELIPFPEEIDLSKLKNFKGAHLDLLSAFRNKIELLVLDPNIDDKSDLFSEKINELLLRKEELVAKMKENKLGVRFGSISGVAGALPGLHAGTAIDTVLGILGLTGAIYSALSNEKTDPIFDQSGLKYLALVDTKLRRPKLYRSIYLKD